MPLTDPDQLLSQIRADILKWEKAIPYSEEEWGASERITSAIAALDQHLSEGGPLPRAWRTTRDYARTLLPTGEDVTAFPAEPITGSGNLMGSRLTDGHFHDGGAHPGLKGHDGYPVHSHDMTTGRTRWEK